MDVLEAINELDKFIEVENADGSSEAWPKPEEQDCWLDCWESRSKKKAKKCFCCDSDKDLVGAHVLITDEFNGLKTKVYLTVLCKKCNNLNEPFEIDKSTLVDVTDICPFRDIASNYKERLNGKR